SSCPPFKWFLGRKHCITGHGDDLFFLHNYMDLIGRRSERSRKSVHCALLKEKKLGVVTQERSSCPPQEEEGQSGHARAFIVPFSRRKSLKRSCKVVQRALLARKKEEEITQPLHLHHNLSLSCLSGNQMSFIEQKANYLKQ
ncbi:hypothetical protein, partial [Lederbergia graminis]